MSIEREKPVPTYRRHRQSGQGIVTLTDGLGRRKDVLLGPYGTRASRAEYARVIAEWEANDRRLVASPTNPGALSINELCDAFWEHAKRHYRRPDGSQTTEVSEYRLCIRALRHLYADNTVASFTPLALKAVRTLLVTGYEHPRYGKQPALARNVINKRISRIRHMFAWAVENDMVSVDVLTALEKVQGLQAGRSEVRETAAVKPIPRAVVEATIPALRPMLADMVRLLMESGMRAGELCVMRACDLDTTGHVWLYRPGYHKGSWRAQERVIALGPKCQEIVKKYLLPDLQAYLYSPERMREEQNAERRDARKTPLYPSHVRQMEAKRKRKPRRAPGERYTSTSLGRALYTAIRKYNGAKPEAERLPYWHLHQLRHLRALELKREVGLDVARACLGHADVAMSERYAGLDVASAVQAMAKLG